MASPQCENGYTKIANELLDAIIRTRFPGQEMRIMLAVLRRTYGFGKKADQISYGQLAQATEIPRTRVIEHVKSLVSKKGLGSLVNGTRRPLTLWINKDFEEWMPSPKHGTSLIEGTSASPIYGNRSSPIEGTHKRKKENKRKPIIIPDWISEELWQDFKEHRKKLKKPMTDKAEELLIKKLAWLKEKGHNPKHLLMTSIERGWLSVFEPKEN